MTKEYELNKDVGQEPDYEPANLDGFTVSMGFVVRTSLADSRRIEEFLKSLPATKVLFVKRSTNHLWIVQV
jgi:hypothetical protein